MAARKRAWRDPWAKSYTPAERKRLREASRRYDVELSKFEKALDSGSRLRYRRASEKMRRMNTEFAALLDTTRAHAAKRLAKNPKYDARRLKEYAGEKLWRAQALRRTLTRRKTHHTRSR